MAATGKVVVAFDDKSLAALKRTSAALEHANDLTIELAKRVEEKHDDQTMTRFHTTLRDSIMGLYGTPIDDVDKAITGIISHIQNAGFLIRERK